MDIGRRLLEVVPGRYGTLNVRYKTNLCVREPGYFFSDVMILCCTPVNSLRTSSEIALDKDTRDDIDMRNGLRRESRIQ